MKTKLTISLALLGVLSSQAFAQSNQCIVTFKEQVNINDVEIKAKKMAKQSRGNLKHIYKNSFKGFTVELPCQAVRHLYENNSDVLKIEEDIAIQSNRRTIRPTPRRSTPVPVVPDEPETVVDNEKTSYGTLKVGGPFNGVGKTAWIVDSGIDLDHPDLNVNISKGYSVYSTLDDDNGHGTHVAGIIGAIQGNSIGTVGVAQGATVIPVKVLDSNGAGTLSGILAGLDHIAQYAQKGECINMSLGAVANDTLDNAIINTANLTGAFFTIAAGNNSDDANNYSPARANGLNIYTISAVGENNEFAWFSNYGNPPIDYAAPGIDILSLWNNGSTNTISGTSMAAPHACGVLLVSGDNAITPIDTAIGDTDGFEDPIIHY